MFYSWKGKYAYILNYCNRTYTYSNETYIYALVKLFQVLSKSVADAFDYYGEHDTIETQKFVRTFDQFFDMLNTRSQEEGIYKRKPDLLPLL